MKLDLSEDQLLLRDSILKVLQKQAATRQDGAAGKSFDRTDWKELSEAGFLSMLVPESKGGVGFSLHHAAIATQTAGEQLSAIPLTEGIVATYLAAHFLTGQDDNLLARIFSGEYVLSFSATELKKSTGVYVIGGNVADGIIAYDGERLFIVDLQTPLQPLQNLGDLPMARLNHSDIGKNFVTLATGSEAQEWYKRAVDSWRILTASQMFGMASEALRQSAEYACERIAFDRPIGSFQGLAHPLADSITDIDGGQLLVRYALWSIENETNDAYAISPAVYWWASDVCERATLRAMRTFGGYGVSLESKAQLYWRRCRAFALIGGNAGMLLDEIAARQFENHDQPILPDVKETGVDFGLGKAADAFGAGALKYFRSLLNDELREFLQTTDDGHHPEIEQSLAKGGYLHPDWPKEYGGSERGPLEMSALYRAYGEAGWWVVAANTTDMVAKIIMQFGSDRLKSEVLPKLANGEANCALGYSEPSCGSDVFAAKTRAVKDGDEWVINGQKMFTSQGHFAQYALMLTRTDPEAPKHKGLTLFLLPLDQPGYEVQKVDTVGKERTNVTFYNDMRVTDAYRLGEVNGGAKVMAAALMLEQSTGDFFLIALKRILYHGLMWAKTKNHDSSSSENRAPLRSLAKLQVQIFVLEALTRRVLAAAGSGDHNRYYGPMTKLFGSEALVRCSDDLMRAIGADSLVQDHNDLGWIELESRRSVGTTIYAGTSEVQRSIIAEVALGLPRTRN